MAKYTLYAIGLAIALLAAPNLVAAPSSEFSPRMDVSGLPSQTYEIYVPAGHSLVATITADGVELSTTPLTAVPMAGNNGCIMPSGAAWSWVPTGVSVCPAGYAAHQKPISSVTLVTSSSGFADAFDLFTWAYWFVICNAPGYAGGLGNCQVFGSFAGFGYWDAQVGSATSGAALYR